MLAALSMHRAVWLASYAGVCGVSALLLKLQARKPATPQPSPATDPCNRPLQPAPATGPATVQPGACRAARSPVCGVSALLLELQVTRGDALPAAASTAAAAAAAAGGGARRPLASALQARAAHHQRRLQAARLGAAWMAPLGNLACAGALVLGQATLYMYLDG